MIEAEEEVVADRPASSLGSVPLLLLGVALCGGDDDEPQRLVREIGGEGPPPE